MRCGGDCCCCACCAWSGMVSNRVNSTTHCIYISRGREKGTHGWAKKEHCHGLLGATPTKAVHKLALQLLTALDWLLHPTFESKLGYAGSMSFAISCA